MRCMKKKKKFHSAVRGVVGVNRRVEKKNYVANSQMEKKEVHDLGESE